MKGDKILKGLLGLAFMAVGITSCDPITDEPLPKNENYVLSGNVSTSRTLSADTTWVLKGYVYVQPGATLTIQPGTIIKSDLSDKGALIIEAGAKIMAQGTPDKPIVFTSGQAKGLRRPGDWGGVIILGKAPTNRSTLPTIEGGINRQYGGTDPNDNSGIMTYVRIEFGGIAASIGSEINGLTLGAVGAGTTLENIMVSYGNDDAYEFFGGTVNAKNLIAFSNLDDDFDFDFGYTGNIQYGISIKDPAYADNGDAANGVECDNDGSGSLAKPVTHPHLSNFTFIGPNNRPGTKPNHNFANRWRRATQFTIRNSILIGAQKAGFSIESAETANDYINGTSEFKNNILYAVANPFKSNVASLTAAEMQTKAKADGCLVLTNADEAMLVNPWLLTAPNLLPKPGSPALSGADFKGMNDFFTLTTFLGAMGSSDWTANWTNFDPNNADY